MKNYSKRLTRSAKFAIVYIMIKRGRQNGFTVVELLIVIVIMVLLATMVTIAYSNVQRQARDTQVREAASNYTDALRLWMAYHNGNMPQGGSVASGTVSSPDDNVGCSGGGTSGWANGNYTAATYPCTKGSVLQYFGYLPADFFDNLPKTTKYSNNTTNFMIYGPASGKWYLFYSLENPTADEVSKYDALAAGAYPNAANLRTSYNMNVYIDITDY